MSSLIAETSALPDALSHKAFIDDLRARNKAFYEDERGRGALRDLKQSFPHPWLYVAELLQNAVDEKASRISFLINEDGDLIFEHDGNVFTPKDVAALCSRGVSSKGAGTVGFMGVGFKAIFCSFENVRISSGAWRFKLEVPATRGEVFGDVQRDWIGAVLPLWDESLGTPSAGMKCRFVLSARLPGLGATAQDLDKVFGDDFSLLPLLAWRGVEELKWNGSTWALAKSEEPLGGHASRITLEATDESAAAVRHWIMFLNHYKPSREAVARFLEHRQLSPKGDEELHVYAEASRERQVALFCELDEGGSPVPVDRGSAFALLPTGVTLPAGLHVQADWLLVISRQELMQIERNQWHEEILRQIPLLLRHFMAWVADGESGDDWQQGYNALPSVYREDAEIDKWLVNSDFREILRRELMDLSFLPARSPQDDTTFDFISPADARVLPEPLADAFDDDSSKQSFLFGSHIVSLQMLGERAANCLRDIGLLTELKSGELEERWRGGLVGEWLGLFDEGARHDLLARVLKALSELDELETWRQAELVCLPTEAGTWTHRGAVRRFPSEWNVLAQEPLIRSALISYVGPPDTLLAWQKDFAWIRGSSPALRYLAPVPAQNLEKVVTAWWDSLPAEPEPGQVDQVLHFTSWVRGKQQQRKELLRKLLCMRSDGRILLQEASSALLAEPYAGAFRRHFYPDLPLVVSHYLDSDSSVGVEVWRSYFESLNPSPKGKFSLRRSVRSVSRGELTEQMGGNYIPPYLRSTEAYYTWSGLTISYYAITLLDWELPNVVKDSLQGDPLSKEVTAALSHWLLEASGLLREYPYKRIAYIPFGGSSVAVDKLPASSTWVRELTENAWIYNTKGEGPLRTSEVLAAFDLARPDAPVADLPGELVTTLQLAGIQFGTSIPNAPAIARLRVDGPTANPEKLFELFRNAVGEADDEAKRSLLLKTISQQNLFPISQGVARTIDGLTRVPYHRLARTATRSTLGEWVVPIERFKEGSAERNLFEAVHAFVGIPDSTTANQVMDFLEWVWKSMPEADRLRRFLPFAYQYLRNDLGGDGNAKERWNVLAREARVFTTGRRWVMANEGTVFLDDLNNALLLDVLDGVDLATPGHLGRDLDEQIATARLLGLNLLSSRFSVEVLVDGELPLPAGWQTGFEIIQEQLRNQLGAHPTDPSDDEGVSGTPPDFPMLRLTHWRSIRTLIFDGGREMHSAATKVAVHEGTIAVAGEPDGFAEELCKALFNAWGLRLRRDLVDLIPKVAIMLTKIGDEGAVLSWRTSAQESNPIDVSEEPRTTPVETEKSTQGGAGGARPSTAETRPTTSASANDTIKTSPAGEGDSGGAEVSQGGSYTASTREARIQALLKKRRDIEKQLDELATAGLIPDAEDESSSSETAGEFSSDDQYRDAVIAYERKRNRFAAAKSSTQKGHDIDSFTHPEGHPERRLVRRIEVKGRSAAWDGDQIVEMSDSQFTVAVTRLTENGIQTASDFDYWLYVVETDKNGGYCVLPIRNPALRASKFELRGGTWRDFVEHEELAEESGSPS